MPRDRYRPKEHHLNFFEDPINQNFQLNTVKNKKRFSELHRAKHFK